jgi:HK97 gp10 family phage protein
MAQRAKVELQGKDSLKRAFANLSSEARREVKDITRTAASEIEQQAKSRVRVDTGYTQSTVKKEIAADGLGATVGSNWFKARFLEHGTVKMAARPWLFPAFEMVRPKYLERIQAALYGVLRSVRN